MDNSIFLSIVYLLNCFLHNKKADLNQVNNFDIETVKKICRLHKISAIVACVLEDFEKDDYWIKQKNNAIRKTILYENERAELFDFLEKKKIWYLPLKGIIISKYYPQYGVREFSDNDILFDSKYQEIVRNYFIEHGYEVKSFNKSYHDRYTKSPVFCFEMHTSLFNMYSGRVQNKYYINIMDILIKHDGKYELSFTDNDLYVYFMAHAVKHYLESGTGLRTLVDTYILINHLSLDWDYVNGELEKLNILGIASEFKNLVVSLFDEIPLTYDQTVVFNKIWSMGAYGNLENKVDNDLSTTKKGKLLLKRRFPPLKTLEYSHPIVFKYPILLPAFYIKRLIKGFTKKEKETTKEIKYIIKHK